MNLDNRHYDIMIYFKECSDSSLVAMENTDLEPVKLMDTISNVKAAE
jgi:hypothetical protein